MCVHGFINVIHTAHASKLRKIYLTKNESPGVLYDDGKAVNKCGETFRVATHEAD